MLFTCVTHSHMQFFPSGVSQFLFLTLKKLNLVTVDLALAYYSNTLNSTVLAKEGPCKHK